MKDSDCVQFLQWAAPRLRFRWPGFRKVRKQVCKRINRRLRELGLADVKAYRDYLGGHREEWSVLDSFCRISISRFYRDRGVFDYLRDEVLPRLAATAHASANDNVWCWSAGCASGEEVYTLKIIWKLCVGCRFPDVALRVIATDSDSNILDRARRGCYPTSSLKDIPKDWLTAAFTKAGELFCVKPDFREGVEFICQDIRQETPDGLFHMVLCRRLVFTYFDDALQQDMLRRILAKLVSGGILVTGKQERLLIEPLELQPYQRKMGIYQKQT